MDSFVYIYECLNCQRVYPRVAGQPLACPFCQSKERNELGNGYNFLELIDTFMGLLSPTLLRETLIALEAKQKEQDNNG